MRMLDEADAALAAADITVHRALSAVYEAAIAQAAAAAKAHTALEAAIEAVDALHTEVIKRKQVAEKAEKEAALARC